MCEFLSQVNGFVWMAVWCPVAGELFVNWSLNCKGAQRYVLRVRVDKGGDYRWAFLIFYVVSVFEGAERQCWGACERSVLHSPGIRLRPAHPPLPWVQRGWAVSSAGELAWWCVASVLMCSLSAVMVGSLLQTLMFLVSLSCLFSGGAEGGGSTVFQLQTSPHLKLGKV